MIGRGFDWMLDTGIGVAMVLGLALLGCLIVLFAYEAVMDRRQ